MKCKPHKSVLVKCTLCVYVHKLSSFIFSTRLKIKCHVAVTNIIEHLYDDTKVLMVLTGVETCHILLVFFNVNQGIWVCFLFVLFVLVFFPQMNSEVVYGTRTAQKKTNPGSEKSSVLVRLCTLDST